MHILYIYQYFATPFGRTSTRAYDFARRWVAKGHKVTMLTTTSQLTSEDLAQASGWFLKRFTIDGVDVLALVIPYRQQMGMFKRCLAFLAFLLLASVIVLFIRKVDVVYATSTPLTIGIPAVVSKWLRQKKFIFEVRDQWPASPVEMGIIRNRIVIKLLIWLEKTIYKQSAAIVTFSDGMAEGIRQVAGEEKPIYVIPNGTDLDLFRPDINGNAIRRDKGWGDKLVLLQAGAIGRTNGLEFIVDVAEQLKDYQDILFVLIGQGSMKGILQNRIKELGLKNVEIWPSVPKQQLPAIFAAVDVAMSVMANFAIFERHASLNKFYDGLGSGKPMLLNYSGWQGQLIKDNNAGFCCKLCDVDEFVEKVLYLNSHREKLTEMGRNARRIAEEKFDRNKLAQQVLDLLNNVIELE